MKIILLALLLFTSTPSFSQGINGKYKNVYGEEIVIFDGMFYLIAKKTERCIAIWQPDTLAICEVKQINKSVLEVYKKARLKRNVFAIMCSIGFVIVYYSFYILAIMIR